MSHTKLLLLALVAATACDPATTATGGDGQARGPIAKADLTGSCVDGDALHCGGPSSGTCWCDAECLEIGDCCADAVDECLTAPTEMALLFDEGLDAPESVAWDPKSETFFVSNLAHNILETDPLHPPEGKIGFLSRHAADGTVIAARWAEHLVSPKGVLVHDGLVYVADPQEVVVFAVDGEAGDDPVARFTDAAAGLFNDIAAGEDGLLYVTDTGNPGLYRLDPRAYDDEPALTELVRDPRFEFPNGVAVDGDTAYVATTGLFPSEEGPGTPGRLFAIDIGGKKTDVREVQGVLGKWDGVVALDDGRIAVNDFMTGSLHIVDRSGGEPTVIPAPFEVTMPPAGLADMNAAGSMLVLPSMFTNQVFVFTP